MTARPAMKRTGELLTAEELSRQVGARITPRQPVIRVEAGAYFKERSKRGPIRWRFYSNPTDQRP